MATAVFCTTGMVSAVERVTNAVIASYAAVRCCDSFVALCTKEVYDGTKRQTTAYSRLRHTQQRLYDSVIVW